MHSKNTSKNIGDWHCTDILFPLTEQEFLAANIPDAEYSAINSPYGHDGFLLEYEQIEEARAVKPSARFSPAVKDLSSQPGRRFRLRYVAVFSPGSCMPRDVGAFGRDASNCYEAGRFLACILAASAAVEITSALRRACGVGGQHHQVHLAADRAQPLQQRPRHYLIPHVLVPAGREITIYTQILAPRHRRCGGQVRDRQRPAHPRQPQCHWLSGPRISSHGNPKSRGVADVTPVPA